MKGYSRRIFRHLVDDVQFTDVVNPQAAHNQVVHVRLDELAPRVMITCLGEDQVHETCANQEMLYPYHVQVITCLGEDQVHETCANQQMPSTCTGDHLTGLDKLSPVYV